MNGHLPTWMHNPNSENAVAEAAVDVCAAVGSDVIGPYLELGSTVDAIVDMPQFRGHVEVEGTRRALELSELLRQAGYKIAAESQFFNYYGEYGTKAAFLTEIANDLELNSTERLDLMRIVTFVIPHMQKHNIPDADKIWSQKRGEKNKTKFRRLSQALSPIVTKYERTIAAAEQAGEDAPSFEVDKITESRITEMIQDAINPNVKLSEFEAKYLTQAAENTNLTQIDQLPVYNFLAPKGNGGVLVIEYQDDAQLRLANFKLGKAAEMHLGDDKTLKRLINRVAPKSGSSILNFD